MRALAEASGEHHLLTYAAAIAFQALVALVPLTLLALGLLGAIGRKDTWTDSIFPAIRHRVTPAVAAAIDDSAKRVLAHADGLLVFGTLLDQETMRRETPIPGIVPAAFGLSPPRRIG